MESEYMTVPRRLLQLALDALEQARVDPQDFDFGPAYGTAKREFNKAQTELRRTLAAATQPQGKEEPK